MRDDDALLVDMWVTATRDVPALLSALEPVVRPIIESRKPESETP